MSELRGAITGLTAMSNTGKYANRTPGIRQAGLTSALANESSAVRLPAAPRSNRFFPFAPPVHR